jgi:hypothetical protein
MHHSNMEYTMTNANAANANATAILNNLAAAFGGWSQFTDHVVGMAVHGQFNNGGNATVGGVTAADVLDAAAAIIAARWDAEFDVVRAAIQGGFDAARAAIGGSQ